MLFVVLRRHGDNMTFREFADTLYSTLTGKIASYTMIAALGISAVGCELDSAPRPEITLSASDQIYESPTGCYALFFPSEGELNEIEYCDETVAVDSMKAKQYPDHWYDAQQVTTYHQSMVRSFLEAKQILASRIHEEDTSYSGPPSLFDLNGDGVVDAAGRGGISRYDPDNVITVTAAVSDSVLDHHSVKREDDISGFDKIRDGLTRYRRASDSLDAMLNDLYRAKMNERPKQND